MLLYERLFIFLMVDSFECPIDGDVVEGRYVLGPEGTTYACSTCGCDYTGAVDDSELRVRLASDHLKLLRRQKVDARFRIHDLDALVASARFRGLIDQGKSPLELMQVDYREGDLVAIRAARGEVALDDIPGYEGPDHWFAGFLRATRIDDDVLDQLEHCSSGAGTYWTLDVGNNCIVEDRGNGRGGLTRYTVLEVRTSVPVSK